LFPVSKDQLAGSIVLALNSSLHINTHVFVEVGVAVGVLTGTVAVHVRVFVLAGVDVNTAVSAAVTVNVYEGVWVLSAIFSPPSAGLRLLEQEEITAAERNSVITDKTRNVRFMHVLYQLWGF
jgi:hypothetical protein